MRRCTTLITAAFFVFLLLSPALAGLQQHAVESKPQSHPENKKTSESLHFAVMGDTGSGDDAQYAVARQMTAAYNRQPFSFVLMLGDNVYGGKLSKKADKVFNLPYKDLLDKGVRFYATLGNHDVGNAAEQIAFPKFNMGGKTYYSFAPAGDLVEFFTFNSTPLAEKDIVTDELAWLDGALKASHARWKIVFIHHPPYSPGRRHGNNKILIEKLVPILTRNGVRVVMTGHEHFFARMRDRDGIAYIISGSGGKIQKGGLKTDHPDLVAGNDAIQQFLTVTLTEDAFAYTVTGSNGADLFHEAIPFEPEHP